MIKITDAIAPFDNYCDGFGSPGASGCGYFLGLSLGVGKSDLNLAHEGSDVLAGINAFDRAETDTAYIGQLNMSIVSSFCGLNGIIWGYDVVRPTSLFSKHPLAPGHITYNGRKIPVFSAYPLIEATMALFGTVDKLRFPLIPGAHVPFAGKNVKSVGPKTIYSAIAIGIPLDREKNACLLMEDMGYIPNVGTTQAEFDKYKRQILKKLAKSVIEVGVNQRVEFRHIFLEMREIQVLEGEIGCSLVAAPYFTLAKNALPENTNLRDLRLEDWENLVKKDFLCNNS